MLFFMKKRYHMYKKISLFQWNLMNERSVGYGTFQTYQKEQPMINKLIYFLKKI